MWQELRSAVPSVIVIHCVFQSNCSVDIYGERERERGGGQEYAIYNNEYPISCCWTKLQLVSWSIVSIPTGGAGWLGFDFLHGASICFFFTTSRSSFGSIKRTVQWVRLFLTWRKAAGAWIWQPFSPHILPRVKNLWALLRPICLSWYGLLRTKVHLPFCTIWSFVIGVFGRWCTHGCTNPRYWVSRATKFDTGAHNVCGP